MKREKRRRCQVCRKRKHCSCPETLAEIRRILKAGGPHDRIVRDAYVAAFGGRWVAGK